MLDPSLKHVVGNINLIVDPRSMLSSLRGSVESTTPDGTPIKDRWRRWGSWWIADRFA
jgi:hypothetical protein